jgi:predicted dehydrogenase
MKILIIGLGSIGKKHVKAINSILPNAEIFALRSTINAKIYPGITNIFYFEEIESLAFDFAIIANPTSAHKSTIAQLIPFGFPLFIEKPISSSLDIEELVNTVTINRISTYVACNLRFLDCLKFIKENLLLFPNKRLNEVNVYCGSYLPEWRPNVNFREIYSAIPELGGGVHIDLVHELDYLYWLFGMPNKVTRVFKSQSSLAIHSFDYANYVLDYTEFCAGVVLNYYRRDSKRSLELVFEDETWHVDLLQNQITCNNQIIFKSEQKISDTYQPQMKYFVDCLNENKPTFNSISNAYNVLKICLGK